MVRYDINNDDYYLDFKDIEIDDYLKNLQHDLEKDESIRDLCKDDKENDITSDSLRNDLSFFTKNGIELHKVNVLFDDCVMELSPYFIDINLDDRIRAHINRDILRMDKVEPYFKSIDIGKINEYYPRINYIHEIVHSQVNSFYNMNDEYNRELLPIFMELVYSDVIGYPNRVSDRLDELKRSLAFAYDPECLEQIKYYTKSLLQALQLYRIYNSSDNTTKKDIMFYINVLFNRHINLEDFLSIYGITYDNILYE